MKKTYLFSILIPLFLLAACTGIQPPETGPTAVAITETPIPPTAVTEPEELSSITVCLGAEPNTLYPFGELNEAARAVLAVVYEGPVDIVSYQYVPSIFTTLPSLENGDAQIVQAQVSDGSRVVDADGNVVVLESGMRIRPASCRSDDCAVTYDGLSPIEVDQMIVTFRLDPALTWSDGVPLTADDSYYSFELQAASDPENFLIERTQVYEVADAQTLQWWGMPGYIDPTFFMNFWSPAPRHLWSGFPSDELAGADFASRTPVGWGPYVVEEWIPGDRIDLKKNPYYFRAADGYPKIDQLTFRFVPDPNIAIGELSAGRCDILDPTIDLDEHVDVLQGMDSTGQANLSAVTGMAVEWLVFGMLPASHDDGYNIQADRQAIFSDPNTRQGIAFCLNRQAVVDNVLLGLTTVPKTYVPSDHPLVDANTTEVPYDPQLGLSFLQLAGWQDLDEDPSTPLRAVNVRNVAYNTPLQLTYYTTPTTQRRQAAEIFKASLAECGIGIDVKFLSPNDLYAAGPVGPLFGRNFDLAQFALGVEGSEPACDWFTSEAIPNEENGWSGVNITGFSDQEYDVACRGGQTSLRSDQVYVTDYLLTQVILAQELPAIPLYHRLRVAASRADVCGFELDATANPLWNIEAIEVGESCQN